MPELIGQFDWCLHVFDDDTEDRAIVGRLADNTIIVGPAKKGSLKRGITYLFTGDWNDHPKYGRQFRFNGHCVARPITREGVIAYLSRLRGIGSVLAERIWETQGELAIDLLQDCPEMVARQTNGLSEAVARAAAGRLKADDQTHRTTADLLSLLSGGGFPRGLWKELIHDFGASAPDMIRKNPFQLCRYPGVGFPKAFALYCKLGLDPTDPECQKWCAYYAVHSNGDGSTWHSKLRIAEALLKQIGGTDVDASEATELAYEDHLLTPSYFSPSHVATTARANAEESVGQSVVSTLSEAPA